ncbi:MAG TPA: hypothetical protein PK646_03815 [Bacillota bacterium]|jgi:hypothetical protein|nr:hypothetical protein [Fastidiosipila sp.]HPX93425.1 hypothetical protein [Bacillota bacterium]HQB81197.1 hypothetical protein [Bacillota bacterium]
MPEDRRKSGDVRRREIKPRSEPPKKGESQAGKSRQKKEQRGSSPGQERGGKRAGRQGQQRPKSPSGAGSREKADAVPQPQVPGPDSQERKKRSSRNRRRPKKSAKQEGQPFRGEETAADITRDIARIEKDIQLDLDGIRNQKLDL